eukprot:GABV01003654.1.p1 GENE.GABV01003654.1~~GABV01003654.1.p1  ORF type:complete len:176 (+),score=48.70 GABV01003654.1:2-529(+)
MGQTSSSVLDQLPPGFPPSARFVGLKNFGNTCFINAVLQALYACKLFRDLVRQFNLLDPPPGNKIPRAGSADSSLIQSLSFLFGEIDSLKKQTGTVSPDHFVQQVRSENELFRVPQHHDAQEFLNFLLNSISTTLHSMKRKSPEEDDQKPGDEQSTWIQNLFVRRARQRDALPSL